MAFLHVTLYLKDSSAQCFPLWKQMTEFSVATAAHWLTHKLKLKTFYQKKPLLAQIHHFAQIFSDEE